MSDDLAGSLDPLAIRCNSPKGYRPCRRLVAILAQAILAQATFAQKLFGALRNCSGFNGFCIVWLGECVISISSVERSNQMQISKKRHGNAVSVSE